MRTHTSHWMSSVTWLGIAVVIAMLGAACGGGDDTGGTAMPYDDAVSELDDLVADITWVNDPIDWKAPVDIPVRNLAATLPPIDEFPLVVTGHRDSGTVVVEVFASTEKSGSGTDGWIVEVAEAFNDSDQQLTDGRDAAVEIRKIASGTGFQFIAGDKYAPDAFTPSNQLWIEMAAAQGVTMTPVRNSLVSNVAGIVMEDNTAQRLEEKFGPLDARLVLEAVVQGDLTMAYTDPYASSTGLNFLVTTLSDFAGGDEDRFLDADVVSAFESFQRNVPFVALTTLQIRESVEAGGTLDAFVMEWQTYVNTDSLKSGYRFIPFGVAHTNPLYAVGDLTPEKTEVLELFAAFAESAEYQELATVYGFDPEPYTPGVVAPSGDTLIAAQQLWKENKDGGRPVVAVFVADVSGSMAGSRLSALQDALLAGMDYIEPDVRIGLIEFNDTVRLVVPIAEFNANQRGFFAAAVQDMDARGGTAMYDAVAVGVQLLVEEERRNPDAKTLLFVLTDGETSAGHRFGDVDDAIAGINIPVYTVGFEANIDELMRLSSLVEAATLNASEEDVKLRIASMFNAQL